MDSHLDIQSIEVDNPAPSPSPSATSTISLLSSSLSELSDDNHESLSPSSSCSSTKTYSPPSSQTAKGTAGNMKWDDFRFPIPPGLKKGVDDVPDAIRKQIIRDAYTCMRAVSQSKISFEDFKVVAQNICSKVPQLKDVKPPGFYEGLEFPYWVSMSSDGTYPTLPPPHPKNKQTNKQQLKLQTK